MKQTAVEWFFNEMEKLRVEAEITNIDGNDFIIAKVKLLQQAKEMEKEWIIDFTRKAVRKILDEDRQNPFNLEQYYKETYKQD